MRTRYSGWAVSTTGGRMKVASPAGGENRGRLRASGDVGVVARLIVKWGVQ
jgi:hypothetical protein